MFIEFSLLPEQNEDKMKVLYDDIVACIRSMPGLQDLPGREMPPAFNKDLMAWGLGTEIIIKVMDIPPQMTEKSEVLLLALRDLIAKVFPEAKAIDCYEVPYIKKVSLLR